MITTASSIDVDTEFHRIVNELTRRGFLTGSLGAAALFGLAACGSSGRSGDSSSTTDPWTFTDDLGRKTNLPARPVRIASTDDLVSVALLKAGVKLCASPLLPAPAGIFPSLDLPTKGITAIANAQNEFNAERLAAAHPDLVVDFISGGKPAVTTNTPTLRGIAPVVALQVNDTSVAQIIESARRFAAAVRSPSEGEDAPDADAKRDYTRALTALRKVVQSKPGLRVAFVLPISAQLNVARLKNTPYMQTLASAGVTFVPDGGASGDFFRGVSWELAPSLPVDVLIPEIVVTDPPSPAWTRMPAVANDQVFPGNPVRWCGYFYANYATLLTELAAFLSNAEIVGPR